MRAALTCVAFACFTAPMALAQQATPQAVPQGEEPVDPYVISDRNAGAKPLADKATFEAFHGIDGIGRIVEHTIDQSVADPRLKEIFVAQDIVRLKRTLKEQICYVLGGPCSYSGRDMQSSHKDLGVQTRDFNGLVEHLRVAMEEENVPFRAQNKLLALFAPMHRDVVTR